MARKPMTEEAKEALKQRLADGRARKAAEKAALEAGNSVEQTSEPVAPQASQPEAPKESDMMTIHLDYQFQDYTDEGRVNYGPGEVTLDRAKAKDLIRRNKEHAVYQKSLHERHEVSVNAGKISGAGK